MSDLKARKKQRRLDEDSRKCGMEAARHMGLRERQKDSKSKVQEKMHATSVKYGRKNLNRNQTNATIGHVRH